MLHNTAQNSSDNLPSLPPDNHHSSDIVTGGEERVGLAVTPSVITCAPAEAGIVCIGVCPPICVCFSALKLRNYR